MDLTITIVNESMSWIQTTAVLLTWNESNRYTWCMLLRTGKKKNFFRIKSNHLHRRCSTAGFISLICPFLYVTACSNITADRWLLPVVEPSISDRRTLKRFLISQLVISLRPKAWHGAVATAPASLASSTPARASSCPDHHASSGFKGTCQTFGEWKMAFHK